MSAYEYADSIMIACSAMEEAGCVTIEVYRPFHGSKQTIWIPKEKENQIQELLAKHQGKRQEEVSMEGPKYRRGDAVTFMATKSRKPSDEVWPGAPRFDQSCIESYTEETVGIVMVVDVGGPIGIGEHSYDIMVAEENTLYKHVRESEILETDEEHARRLRKRAAAESLMRLRESMPRDKPLDTMTPEDIKRELANRYEERAEWSI